MGATKTTIKFDFGTSNQSISTKKNVIKDKEGNIVKFTRMIDALNFMRDNGYEYIDTYIIEKYSETHYILKRKKN